MYMVYGLWYMKLQLLLLHFSVQDMSKYDLFRLAKSSGNIKIKEHLIKDADEEETFWILELLATV